MADLTISSAATLTGAGTASGDLFPLVDVSASAGSKGSKITRDELRIAMGVTGGGTLATAGFTLTLPATGTAALLGTANVFTAAQTVTQGTANAGILASTGYSLTGSNATSMIDLAGTWNTTGTPTAFKLNITNTASNAASLLMDLQVDGVSRFSLRRNGRLTISDPTTSNPSIYSASGQNLFFAASTFLGVSIRQDNGWVGIGYNTIQFLIDATNVTSGDLYLARKTSATLQLGLDAAGVTNQMFTAASRITSDGVGANLTIAGGNGRGGAGGSLIFSTYTTAAAAIIGTLTTRLTLDTNGLLTFADAVDMAFNTTTGTKIGTAATQKLGFWGVSPVAQPGTGGIGAGLTSLGGTTLAELDTFDGYSIGQVVAALRNIGILA